MKSRNNAGFTLLELLIVVIIIGILATVAIPQFTNATKRAKESEARAVIDSILTAEVAYYAEKGVFSQAMSDLIASIPTMKNWTSAANPGGNSTLVSITMVDKNDGTHFMGGIMDNLQARTVTNENGF